MPAVLLITLLTLGGAGLYLAMPGGRLHAGRAALIVLVGAAAALVALLIPIAGEQGQRVWFALFALIGTFGALRVVTHKKPIYSALYFILVVVAVGGLLVLMGATFLAAALLIIYAGAILVTYLFVIMLAQQSAGTASYDQKAREPFVGVVAGFVLLAALTVRLARGDAQIGAEAPKQALGSVVEVGTHLLSQHMLGIEVTGILLLAAMVGAIAIARRRPVSEEFGEVD